MTPKPAPYTAALMKIASGESTNGHQSIRMDTSNMEKLKGQYLRSLTDGWSKTNPDRRRPMTSVTAMEESAKVDVSWVSK